MNREETNYIEYDTDIERIFKLKCESSMEGIVLFSEWIYVKKIYVEKLKTIVFEFPNYSKHDDSHAQKILEYISRLLGDRLELLSVSDLWLLLNCAYSHDIGMSIEFKEMKEYFCDKKSEFHSFIKQIVDKNKSSMKYTALFDSAERFEMLEDIITNGKFSKKSEKTRKKLRSNIICWPLLIKRDLQLILSTFIRDRHADRSYSFFKEEDFTDKITREPRFYHLIGRINQLHGYDFSELLKEFHCCDGLTTDYNDHIHPRFVAQLLRVGDLLDLDNNRFDEEVMKYYGPLPEDSMTHYKKHKSIKNMLVDKNKIRITSESDDLDVCKMCYNWFKFIDEEVCNLILYWGKLAPVELGGCFICKPNLKVYYRGGEYDSSYDSDLRIDSSKAMELFTGNNLYISDLDALREYVQNALDASKLQLWYSLESEEYKEIFLKDASKKNIESITPFDLTKEAYDYFKIKVMMKKIENDEDHFLLIIEDKGIGIDKEAIESIRNIGQGWRARENHTQAIIDMPSWLRPTGGFGIGIQSAFMITDEVRFITKSEMQDGYVLHLTKKNNCISLDQTIDNQIKRRGTRVELVLNYDKILQICRLFSYLPEKEIESMKQLVFGNETNNDLKPIVRKKERHDMILKHIEIYLKIMFRNTLIPVQIYNDDLQKSWIQSANYFKGDKPDGQEKDKEVIALNRNAKLDYLYDNNKLFIYAKESGIFITYLLESYLAKKREYYQYVSYKEVLITSEYLNEKEKKNVYSIPSEVDILGLRVDECLVISRNMFQKNFNFAEKIYEITNTFIKELLKEQNKKSEALNAVGFDIKDLGEKIKVRNGATVLDFDSDQTTVIEILLDNQLQEQAFIMYLKDKLNEQDKKEWRWYFTYLNIKDIINVDRLENEMIFLFLDNRELDDENNLILKEDLVHENSTIILVNAVSTLLLIQDVFDDIYETERFSGGKGIEYLKIKNRRPTLAEQMYEGYIRPNNIEHSKTFIICPMNDQNVLAVKSQTILGKGATQKGIIINPFPKEKIIELQKISDKQVFIETVRDLLLKNEECGEYLDFVLENLVDEKEHTREEIIEAYIEKLVEGRLTYDDQRSSEAN